MTFKAPVAVVFDFDGTLVDSMSAFADIAGQVMPQRHRIDAKEARRLYLETSGIPFFQQLEALFPGDPANVKTAEEFEKAKLEGYFREPLFNDTADTLKHLKTNGIKVAVSSNNFQELVDQFLEIKDLKLDIVLGFKDGFAKGEEHFKYIEQKLCIKRSDITFVGDSLKDGERALHSNVTFIGKEGIFTREQFKEKFPGSRVISTLSELKTIFF